MQRCEVKHWFRAYALEIDEVAGTLKLITPRGDHIWNISYLSGVGLHNESVSVDHGTATENILTGAAIGGKAGAFAAAMGPTGITSCLTKVFFVVRRRSEGQIHFGEPPICFLEPGDNEERIRLPANNKMANFVLEASKAANAVIKKKNTIVWRSYYKGERPR